MKNVHLIRASESRLYYTISMSGYNLKLSAIPIHQSSEVRPQHIYITNSEEIKEGDWVYCRTENRVLISNVSYSKLEDRFKIILTTDPKLIVDGVQAITNTFAEWFVKNPSCEEVEIVKQKEILGEVAGTTYIDFNYKIIIPKEEPKQETLEEAAEKYYKLYEVKEGFIDGAKWQQERMYSEAEVKDLIEDWTKMADGLNMNFPTNKFNIWFERFKQK